MKNNRTVKTDLNRLISKYGKDGLSALLGISVRYINMLTRKNEPLKPSKKLYYSIKALLGQK